MTHFIRYMTVNIQRKCRRRVTKITLQGFDIVSGSQGGNGIGMTQIEKPGVWTADGDGGALEMAVNDMLTVRMPGRIGEYESRIFPRRADLLCLSFLLGLVTAQQLHDKGRRFKNPAFVVFGTDQLI